MHFESSWIVWLKDTAAALMIGTVCDREEVKKCIVASPPVHFTHHNPFYRFYNHIPFCASLTDKDTRHSFAEEGTPRHLRACCIHFAQPDVLRRLRTDLLFMIQNGVKCDRLPVCVQDKLNSLELRQQKVYDVRSNSAQWQRLSNSMQVGGNIIQHIFHVLISGELRLLVHLLL